MLPWRTKEPMRTLRSIRSNSSSKKLTTFNIDFLINNISFSPSISFTHEITNKFSFLLCVYHSNGISKFFLTFFSLSDDVRCVRERASQSTLVFRCIIVRLFPLNYGNESVCRCVQAPTDNELKRRRLLPFSSSSSLQSSSSSSSSSSFFIREFFLGVQSKKKGVKTQAMNAHVDQHC